MINSFAPVHPGEILRQGFLAPTRLSAHTLARVIGVPPSRIERIASEQAPITTDTAVRLARYFGTTVQFWIGLQAQHDLEYARHLVSRDRERPQLHRLRMQAAADSAPRQSFRIRNKRAGSRGSSSGCSPRSLAQPFANKREKTKKPS